MKIIKLQLKNWMIFKGNQEIKFSDGHENVSLIFGENMHGKTSLLNSIRWCLYGVALNRQQKVIPPQDLINSIAFQDNDHSTSVLIHFEVDGFDYELKREIDFSEVQLTPLKSLRINGRVVDGGKIDFEINKILPEQISQFMLFDGELLNSFENLVVAEGSAQAIGIKNAIEETLGIPKVRKLFEASDKFYSEMQKETKKELEKNNASKLIADKLAELSQKKDILINEKQNFKENIDLLSPELDELLAKMRDGEEAIRLITQRKNLEKNLREETEQNENSENELKLISSNLYLVPLRLALDKKIEKYKQETTVLEKKHSEAQNQYFQMIKLENSLGNSSCQVCGSSLSEKEILKLEKELSDLKEKALANSNIDNLIFDLKTKLKKLTLLPDVPDETQKYDAIRIQRDMMQRKMTDIEGEIYNIKEKLRDVDEKTSITNRTKYDAINKEIAVLEDHFDNCIDKIEILETEMKDIRKSKEYENISNDSNVLKKAEKAEQIKDILSNAMSLYRDKMRDEVEKRATDTFKNLTSEQTFDKLEINDNYGLSLIVDGKKVNRSAGAEQIVAMSLIEALNHHGRRIGPMIMDTPVGRLDNTHRKNIMTYLPKVVTQLAIFAHSGELDDDSDLINPEIIGRRYMIKRFSTFHAELVEL